MNTHGGKRKNSGRKKKNKNSVIWVRCSDSEKNERVQAAADEKKTLSDWIIEKTKISLK